MELIPEPLTPQAFAPFGEVLDLPQQPERLYYDAALGNLRPAARPSLSLILKPETVERPLGSAMLERHQFSSQSFVPLDVGRWLIVVAPHAAVGGPDLAAARAFVADGRHGVTYRADTWHHGLTTLDRPGRFAVFMWRTGGAGDEEFVPVSPFTVRLT
ncbi:MAG: ureidoglycolate lyase [Reyranellaceae bacterium]